MAKKIKGVEVFSEGVWNGQTITPHVLTSIVDAFTKTSTTVRPFLKLGHNDDQPLLDGQPAAGWVSNLYVKGKKLLADFEDIPKKIFELIKAGAYRKVSIELFRNVKIEEETYPHLLGAIALLGAETPAVMNLDDILARYRAQNLHMAFEAGSLELSRFDYQLESRSMPDPIKPEDGVSREDFAAVKASLDSANEQIAQLRKDKSEAEVSAFMSELRAEKLVCPAMEPIARQLVGACGARSDFAVGDAKDRRAGDAVKELLRLARELGKLNFAATTSEVETAGSNKTGDGEVTADQVLKFASDHSMDFETAYRTMLRGKGK